MQPHFYLQDRDAVSDAAALMDEFGAMAGIEAAARASRSRAKGNVIHFCHWRQIKRLVEWMESDESDGTLH